MEWRVHKKNKKSPPSAYPPFLQHQRIARLQRWLFRWWRISRLCEQDDINIDAEYYCPPPPKKKKCLLFFFSLRVNIALRYESAVRHSSKHQPSMKVLRNGDGSVTKAVRKRLFYLTTAVRAHQPTGAQGAGRPCFFSPVISALCYINDILRSAASPCQSRRAQGW